MLNHLPKKLATINDGLFETQSLKQTKITIKRDLRTCVDQLLNTLDKQDDESSLLASFTQCIQSIELLKGKMETKCKQIQEKEKETKQETNKVLDIDSIQTCIQEYSSDEETYKTKYTIYRQETKRKDNLTVDDIIDEQLYNQKVNTMDTGTLFKHKIRSHIPVFNSIWEGNPELKTDKKIGVVVTTHGMWGVHVRQCLECYQRQLTNFYVVLYINESDDEITLELKDRFPEFEIILIDDQTNFGGLTGTWNAGIDKCIENGCDILILSNDDILFDQSIHAILWEAGQIKDELVYFGPLTNKPGPALQNKPQLGLCPIDKDTEEMRYKDDLVNLNGFFMVFPKHVVLANRFNETTYFDPSYPFGGNETEWFERFKNKGGIPKVVYRTFIYHYKYARFRENQTYNETCLYTINTGNYEGDCIYIEPDLPIDYLYFTDNFQLVYQCIQKGIQPYYITHSDSKLLQRTVKTSPHKYLPHIYERSIYIDGNIALSNTFTQDILDIFLSKTQTMICFSHPDRQSVLEESTKVIELKLETKDNVDKLLTLLSEDKFQDNVGLTETNVLIRKHKQIKEFSEEWTRCIEVCRRDQLSFDYLLWKHKLNHKRLSHDTKFRLILKAKHINTMKRFVY